MDVVVREGSSIFQLLSSKDQTLLVGRDSFLVLDLLLDVLNGIAGLYFQSNSLSSQGLNEDLHSSSQTKDQMESGFLLDVVVTQSSSIFELLSSEDESMKRRRINRMI